MKQTSIQRLKYIISDALTVNVGWLCFNVARYFSLPPDYVAGTFAEWYTDTTIILGQILIAPAMIILYAISGYYNNDGSPSKSRLDEFLNTVIISFIAMLCIFFTALINDNIPERLKNYELMLILLLCLSGPTYLCRLIISTRRWRHVRQGRFSIPAILIYSGDDLRRQASRIIESAPRSGLKIAAIANPQGVKSTDDGSGIPSVPLSELKSACESMGVSTVILMPQPGGLQSTLELINTLYRMNLRIMITPDLYQLITMRPRMSSVVSEPLVDITNANIPAATVNLKRLGDIVFSLAAIIALIPVYAVIAIVVKADSPGPVFYRQKRIGYHKKEFYINKFRTMRTDAEDAGPRLSSDSDPRITRAGHILRKYRLDELPQFWNVLVGEMSLVGPRPEREYYIRKIEEYVPSYNLIHQVRPGITSWGMVKYGYASNIDEMIERLRYDMLYIENVSFSVDLKILFHTVNTVITGKGV